MTQYATIDAQTLKSRLDAGEDLTLVDFEAGKKGWEEAGFELEK